MGAGWPQWGGPQRDFRAPAELADSWEVERPRLLWSRDLGEGYSGIAAAGGRLFTLYRDGEEEVLAAIYAASGNTAWEHRYPAPIPEEMRLNHGTGPHSTPLVSDGIVVSAGATGLLFAVREESGEVLWSRDLVAELGGSLLHRGYASSPIAFGDRVIVQVGGAGHAVVALGRDHGRVVWQSQDFDNSPSSPILIRLDGRPQLVVFMARIVAGLDPAGGEPLWSHPHPSGRYYNISTPVWGADGMLFVSAAYGGGSRVLRLRPRSGGTAVEELWKGNQIHVHFTNAIRRGDYIYGSSGESAALTLAAVRVESGEIAWKDREIGRANLIDAGELVLALNEDGRLFLLRLGPAGPERRGEMQLFEGLSRTVPSLVGKTLYARDRRRLVALELP